jgi:HlyD family secretion protein
MKKVLLLVGLLLSVATAVFVARPNLFDSASAKEPLKSDLPVTSVRRGDVVMRVHSRGELQGSNNEMQIAPMTGGRSLVLTQLKETGEIVQPGDIVAEFDTTEQRFKLSEAESDLAEAAQQVVLAKQEAEAKREEILMALEQAKADLKLAQLEVRRNELLPAMAAKQNNLSLESALDRVSKLEKDLKERIAAALATVAIQEAGETKAKVAAETQRKTIQAMTLRAKSAGYVARQPNTDTNFNWGSYAPPFQVGDNVRAGMPVAQIPDMSNWEVSASLGELDRGYVAEKQAGELQFIALPGRTFQVVVKSVGGTSGPPWDRKFECRLTILNPAKELRPGMSAKLTLKTGELKNVLWLPSQALFENDGKRFVYLQTPKGFIQQQVKMLRRSETQVVVEGLQEGDIVAMASPDQMRKTGEASKSGGAMGALGK